MSPNDTGLPSPNGTEEGEGSVEAGSVGGAVLIALVYSLVCLVGLGGNSMVIFVILRHARMRTATNLYILNLAVADELLLLSVPFLVTAALLRHWPFGAALCRLLLSLDALNMFTSVYGLTVLSVDRYVAVVHPLRAARLRRPRVAKLVSLAVWALALLVMLPIAVLARTAANRDGTVACNVLMPEPARSWLVGFALYTCLLGFVLPVGAIGLCYALILAKLRGVALRAGWQQRRRSERKITVMVVSVVSVFVLCWMPFYVVQLVSVFAGRGDATVSQLAVILGYANSCANPILYGFLSEPFKRSFQRLLCGGGGGGGGWAGAAAADEPGDYFATAVQSRPGGSGDDPAGPPARLELPGDGPGPSGPCPSRTTTL